MLLWFGIAPSSCERRKSPPARGAAELSGVEVLGVSVGRIREDSALGASDTIDPPGVDPAALASAADATDVSMAADSEPVVSAPLPDVSCADVSWV